MGEGLKRKKFHDRDRYYRLAKEQGYRSRAAFKLTQINRQFPTILNGQNTRVVLDLCAAPGGWTQVVSRTLPSSQTHHHPNHAPSTVIIAVDVLPIRQFVGRSNVVTIVGDITTDSCRSEIRRAIRDHAILDHNTIIKDDDNNNNNKNNIVDLVLHDGAPNVGASYDRDAYEQTELSLHALKCATEHLRRGGTFVTKLYRSRDYASFLWILRQLFRTVQAVKPTASRSQSAEVFVVCLHYAAPRVVDRRFFDPRHVFAHVEGDSTGGGNGPSGAGAAGGAPSFNVFHKNWNQPRRQRQGYDMSSLDFSMRRTSSVVEFVTGGDGATGRIAYDHDHDDDDENSPSNKSYQNPVDILSRSTSLAFACRVCSRRDRPTTKEGGEKTNDDDDDVDVVDACPCRFFLDHPATTSEIKLCLGDLKVLNRSDFRGLLHWRSIVHDAWTQKMRGRRRDGSERAAAAAAGTRPGKFGTEDVEEEKGEDDDDDDDDEQEEEEEDDDDDSDDDDEEDEDEDEVQEEIAALRRRKMREQKRQKKKDRALASKRRRRAALLGFALPSSSRGDDDPGDHAAAAATPHHHLPEHDQTFRLSTLAMTEKQLEAAREVDLDKVTHEEIFGRDSDNRKRGTYDDDDDDEDDDDDDEVESQGERDDVDDETGYSYRLDRELDDAYDRYLRGTKSGRKAAQSGTKMAKRSKRAQRLRAMEAEMEEDEKLLVDDANTMTPSKKKKKKDGRDDRSDLDDDTREYADMLSGRRRRAADDDSDDEDDDDEYANREDGNDDSGDGYDEEPMTPEEHEAAASAASKKKRKAASSSTSQEEKKTNRKSSKGDEHDDDDDDPSPSSKKGEKVKKNPLIHKLEVAPAVKTARWFSNPLFESIGNMAEVAAAASSSSSSSSKITSTTTTTNTTRRTTHDDKTMKKIMDEMDRYDDDDDGIVSDGDGMESDGRSKAKSSKDGGVHRRGDGYDDVMLIGSDDDDGGGGNDDGNPRSKKKKKGTNERSRNGGPAGKRDDDGTGGAANNAKTRLTADDVLASMPKTDKQIRHEKRLKSIERNQRRLKRRAQRAGDDAISGPGGGFELVPATGGGTGGGGGDDDDDDDDWEKSQQLREMSEEQRSKVLQARALIKAGLGNPSAGGGRGGGGGGKDDGKGFEVVGGAAATATAENDIDRRPLPVRDDRPYDSENEDYDSDDYARTLALGTMMLRRSRAKSLVDASYNRFAWNDPSDLPDWFVDDETRHYRPQLPIPPALIAKMKERQMSLAVRPIAKVAEARARKGKMARAKLAAAKKKAEALAQSSDMSEAMKLKAISKAMRGHDTKKPGKTYVVAKKGRRSNGIGGGGKGVKVVDKRMKSDKRALERAVKKKKKGKQGGLVGSKKRRQHS